MAFCNVRGDELPGSITPRGFLDQFRDYAFQEGLCSMEKISFKDNTFKTTQKQTENIIVFRDNWPPPRCGRGLGPSQNTVDPMCVFEVYFKNL
jgi:hypothetical protein